MWNNETKCGDRVVPFMDFVHLGYRERLYCGLRPRGAQGTLLDFRFITLATEIHPSDLLNE
ncbi:hypothetical protein N9M41_07110 [Rhodopirellula sp.]|nr:hypothetical protein [Rhodopirellula sp.]